MANYQVLVKYKNGIFDAESERIKKDTITLGINGIVSIKTSYIYEISGNISFQLIKRICKDLLVDPVTQMVFINFFDVDTGYGIEIYYKKGVTDSVADTLKIGIADMGIKKELSIRTGRRYFLAGRLSPKDIIQIAEKVLSNPVVQEYRIIHAC